MHLFFTFVVGYESYITIGAFLEFGANKQTNKNRSGSVWADVWQIDTTSLLLAFVKFYYNVVCVMTCRKELMTLHYCLFMFATMNNSSRGN